MTSGTLHTLVHGLFTGRAERPASAIGAELELIPLRADRCTPVPLHDSNGAPGTVTMLRHAADVVGWREASDAYGAPEWHIAGGGRLSFEPGGQLELSSPVLDGAPELIAFLGETVELLRSAANMFGIDLLAVGVDPCNDVARVPLQIAAPRYQRMQQWFDTIGPSGVRMMRQTASLQLSFELGERPLERWRLLNALTPYLSAAFSNSRRYAGADSGYASYRAHLWRTLDPSRTGLPYDSEDPIGAYARFAAAAGRILPDDAAHLTTLFPEVRPRGYFELRTLDAQDGEALARAITVVHTLVTSEDASAAAAAVVGRPDPRLLEVAARDGLEDPTLAAGVRALERIADDATTR